MTHQSKTPGVEPGDVLSRLSDCTTDADAINDSYVPATCDVASFTNAAEETDKTDITDYAAVTNNDFLLGIFGEPDGDLWPVIVSFSGHPNKVPKSNWFGHAWASGTSDLASTHNNYFSISSFCPNEAGQYRRQKVQFRGLYAVYFDDVGTKVDNDLVILAPSWRLATSPGNFQVGYILDKPLTDGGEADRLMKAIIAKGLCDPGAGGPTARLARLPVGVNGKYDPPFQCRLTEWEPDRRYTVAELVDAYDSGCFQNRDGQYPHFVSIERKQCGPGGRYGAAVPNY